MYKIATNALSSEDPLHFLAIILESQGYLPNRFFFRQIFHNKWNPPILNINPIHAYTYISIHLNFLRFYNINLQYLSRRTLKAFGKNHYLPLSESLFPHCSLESKYSATCSNQNLTFHVVSLHYLSLPTPLLKSSSIVSWGWVSLRFGKFSIVETVDFLLFRI